MKNFLRLAGAAAAGFVFGCLTMHCRHLEAENETLTDMLDDSDWPCDCCDPCATCEGCDGCAGDDLDGDSGMCAGAADAADAKAAVDDAEAKEYAAAGADE